MTNYAVILQIFLLTHSSLSVGSTGLVVAASVIIVALAGGVILDATDRRRVVLIATGIQAAVSATLAAQAFAGLGLVWLIYCLVAIQSLAGAVNASAQKTFMPNLLRREQLQAGAALQTLTMHASLTAGPALAGLITALLGLKACYIFDVASFACSLYSVARLPSMRVRGEATRPGLRAIGEGFAFISRTKVVLGALVADMSANFFGMPMALFPAINAERFGGHAETLGLLTTAVAVGGLIGSLLSGPVSRIRRQGLGIVVSGAIWGIGLIAFGLSGVFWLAFLSLTLAGAGDVSAVISRTALVQRLTPDTLRGRVSSVEYAVGAGVPQLGNFRAGVIGTLTSSTTAVISGGMAAVCGTALVSALIPALVRYPMRPAGTKETVDSGPRDIISEDTKAELPG